ncbi:Ribokinase-like protein [Lophiostoma macrostomum CBS 122681]|uniref:pyridoxal kinase n=1 Tax=Lophiostoma macrostomum CBS 122681 TaxID=1314788 RepID=A0A6A6TV06_9PLEO|nr:Ribokinase-like protein [Lophiostoma macrostomum CBS 122681]
MWVKRSVSGPSVRGVNGYPADVSARAISDKKKSTIHTTSTLSDCSVSFHLCPIPSLPLIHSAMASETLIPDTRVLAIASHVVHGYVGNKMATFVMQSMGCDVSAINTVHYSNHTAYKQVKGTKTSAEQIEELYEGLRQSNLNTFDVLLTGYMPSADAVKAVGKIARDLKYNAVTKPGSFFWVLDPVMGDNGKLYIPEDVVPQYKRLLREADLILPNQFEAELLSDTTITDINSLAAAIQVLHKTYQIPHVIITSLRLTKDNRAVPSRTPSRTTSKHHTPSDSPNRNPETSHSSTGPTSNTLEPPAIDPSEIENLTIIGSTATSDFKPRLFRIDTPRLPLFFSGTGDMFAALTVSRLIEAVRASSSSSANLSSRVSWQSPDDLPADELPLAKACQKVLASMQAILAKTAAKCEREMSDWDARAEKEGCGTGEDDVQDRAQRRHLALMNASEVKVVRYVDALLDPPNLARFEARSVEERESGKVAEDVGSNKPDQFGVLSLGLGTGKEGAIQVVGEGDRKNAVGEDVGKDSVREAEESANEGTGKESESKKQELGGEQRPEGQKSDETKES